MKVTQRPFQQNSANAYGSTNITYEHDVRYSKNNNARGQPEKQDDGSLYPTIVDEGSEDEVWNVKQNQV